MTNWMVEKDGVSAGPYAATQLKQLAARGDVSPLDLVRKDDESQWESAGRLKGLFPDGTPMHIPPPLPQERSVKETRSSMAHTVPWMLGIVAISLLGIVFGWLFWNVESTSKNLGTNTAVASTDSIEPSEDINAGESVPEIDSASPPTYEATLLITRNTVRQLLPNISKLQAHRAETTRLANEQDAFVKEFYGTIEKIRYVREHRNLNGEQARPSLLSGVAADQYRPGFSFADRVALRFDERAEREFDRVTTELNEVLDLFDADMSLAEDRKMVDYQASLKKHQDSLRSAGYPDELIRQRDAVKREYTTIVEALRKIRQSVVDAEPVVRGVNDLVNVSGISHLVSGSRYFVENKVVTIPTEFESLYVQDRVGPNEVAISGEFRFVGNSEGKNAFGATVNMEQYECDKEYSESLRRAIEFEQEYRPFLKHFEPLGRKNEIESVIQVVRNLLGDDVVAAAIAEGDRMHAEFMATGRPFRIQSDPVISVASAGNNSKLQPIGATASTPSPGLGKRSAKFSSSSEMASFSPDGKRIATAHWNASVLLWNAETLEVERQVCTLDSAAKGCIFIDDDHLFVASKEGQLQIRNLVANRVVSELRLSKEVRCVSREASEGSVYVGLPNGFVRRIDLSPSTVAAGPKIDFGVKRVDWITDLEVSPDGNLLASAGYRGEVILWDLQSKKIRKSIRIPTGSRELCFSPDGKLMAVGTGTGSVFVYETANWSEVLTCEASTHALSAMKFSPDGELIVTGGLDYSLTVWEVSSGKMLKRHWPGKGWLNTVQFSLDGSELLTAHGHDDGRSLTVWPVSSLSR